MTGYEHSKYTVIIRKSFHSFPFVRSALCIQGSCPFNVQDLIMRPFRYKVKYCQQNKTEMKLNSTRYKIAILIRDRSRTVVTGN